MNYTGERIIPWNPVGANVLGAHVARYAWAVRLAYGRRVVDFGCGSGYGSFMLSWGAKHVIGLDVDPEAVQYARDHFVADNLVFFEGDATAPSEQVRDACKGAELMIAFEVVEHLDRPADLIGFAQALPLALMYSVPIGDGSTFHRTVYSLQDALAIGGLRYAQSREGTIYPIDRDLSCFLAPEQIAHVIGVLS